MFQNLLYYVLIISPLCNAEDFLDQIVTRNAGTLLVRCKIDDFYPSFISCLQSVLNHKPLEFFYTEKFDTLESFIYNHC